MIAAQSIQLGTNDIVVTGGMESMSNSPKYLPDARFVFLPPLEKLSFGVTLFSIYFIFLFFGDF